MRFIELIKWVTIKHYGVFILCNDMLLVHVSVMTDHQQDSYRIRSRTTVV